MEKFTLEEIMFAIGIYPAANATEKFSLFLELMNTKFSEVIDASSFANNLKLEKLSSKRKASFASFLSSVQIEEEMGRYAQADVGWTHLLADDYPKLLKEIYIPPVVLFYKGNLTQLENHTFLGVVGSRNYTPYGKQVVEAIIGPIIKSTHNEIAIVSGLAKGIDTEAHMETLKNGGFTVGVIGTGLDQYYPVKNKTLQDFMGQHHLVLSEYPLTAKPLKFHFPERNRIIAGLSRGVLVVEAKKSSGSLITAYNALEEGRDIFAVPGSIFEANREGTHRLLQLGAILTQNSEDILKEWMYI